MSTIMITGDRGFISGYLIERLLEDGHNVVGIDNDWKYGPQDKSFDNSNQYTHYSHDVKDVDFLKNLMLQHRVDYLVASAALIGGITFFHKLAYDLMAENERICAASFDAALWAHKNANLKKIVAISSSMVYENTNVYPTPESEILNCPPPDSTYGFQKLAIEYFCKGASIYNY